MKDVHTNKGGLKMSETGFIVKKSKRPDIKLECIGKVYIDAESCGRIIPDSGTHHITGCPYCHYSYCD